MLCNCTVLPAQTCQSKALLVAFAIGVLAVPKAVGVAEVFMAARGSFHSMSRQFKDAKLQYCTLC